MKPIRTLLYLLTAAVIIISAGCADKSTGGGDSDPTAAGTWALTLIQGVTASDTTDTVVVADSSRKYIIVAGTDLTLYEYEGSGAPALRLGVYSISAAQFVFDHITYAMSFTATSLVLSTASEILTFVRYTDTVPPAYWPTGSMTVDDDDYEPDDEDSTATPLVSGIPQTHTMDSGDRDWFLLQVNQGYVYTVTLTGAAAGYDLRVYDAAGNSLWDFWEDQVSIDEDNGTVTITPYVSGYFYLRVRISQPTVYTISLSAAAVPAHPYTGTWYLATAVMTVTQQDGSILTNTQNYTMDNTPSISILQGNLMISHTLEDDTTYIVDTTLFIYINSTSAVVYGETTNVVQSGNSITADIYLTDQILVRQTYSRYSGEVPPAHWPPESNWEETVPVYIDVPKSATGTDMAIDMNGWPRKALFRGQ